MTRRFVLPIIIALLAACSQQPQPTKTVQPSPPAPATTNGNTNAGATVPPAPGTPVQIAALRKHCGACHAPPRANRHTAAEWPQVISRMELHRVQRGFEAIPPADRAQLLAFLQAGAKP